MASDKCVFDKGSRCVALNIKACEGCAFRKSEEERERSRKMTADRLALLDDDKQARIRLTYYGKDNMRRWCEV